MLPLQFSSNLGLNHIHIHLLKDFGLHYQGGWLGNLGIQTEVFGNGLLNKLLGNILLKSLVRFYLAHFARRNPLRRLW